MAATLVKNANMPAHTESLNQQTLWATQKRLRQVYFLCMETIALCKFEAVHELNVANDAYKELTKVLNTGNLTYTSHNFVSDAVEVLATVVRNRVLDLVAKSKFVGVVIDEGSDITQTSQLVIYYKIVVDGEPMVVFAGTEELIKGDGETVFNALRHRLKKDNVTLDQIVAFGSDGASVMLGPNRGVAGRLLELNPIVVAFHCVNHRGALAVENAADGCEYLTKKYIPTTEHLGRYFRFSNARTRSFYDAQSKWSKQAGADELQRFIKICESAYTRWLTHGKTTKAICVSFIPLAMGLADDEARGDAIATGLRQELLSFPFIGTMLFMSDVFAVLDRFATITQKSAADVDLSVFYDELPGVIAALEHMVRPEANGDDGYLYNTLQALLDTFKKKEADGGPELTIKGRANMNAEWLEGARSQFTNAVVRHLHARFPDKELMRAMYTVFDVNAYPEDRSTLRKHLAPHVELIVKHYSKDSNIVPDSEVAKDEFLPGGSGTTGLGASLFRRLAGVKKTVTVTATTAEVPDAMKDNLYFLPAAQPVKKKTAEKLLKPNDVCTRFLKTEALCDMAPAWVNLAMIYLMYTTCSAECERGVSVLSIVKTGKRNLMAQKTLEQLMMIKIQGPSLSDLDWEVAAVLFFSKKRRRAKVSSKYTKGQASTYKWGDVYGVVETKEANELEAGSGDEAPVPLNKKQKAAKKKAKEEDIKARIYSGHNPDSQKAKTAKKKEAKASKKRKRAEEKEADQVAYDALDGAGKKAHNAKASEHKKQKKSKKKAAKQRLDASVVQTNKREKVPSQASLKALQNSMGNYASSK
jgi:hypothetical protein